jgi:hypothetical protein
MIDATFFGTPVETKKQTPLTVFFNFFFNFVYYNYAKL